MKNRVEYLKEYRQKFGDIVHSQIIEWFKNHPDYYKKWRRRHPDYLKNWLKQHPDYLKKWKEKHKEHLKDYIRNYMKLYRKNSKSSK